MPLFFLIILLTLAQIQNPQGAGQYSSLEENKITISVANWYFSVLLLIDHISEDVENLSHIRPPGTFQVNGLCVLRSEQKDVLL